MMGADLDSESPFAVSEDRLASASLPILMLLTAIIIILNFFIGIFAPTSSGLDDEISFHDTLWRVVVGQRVGIDYHNPMGFGPYQLGALLWHWLGPHDYIMRLSITLFSLSIAFCGCVVAQRKLVRRADLALLFCVTLAFQLSSPTLYPGSPMELGIAEFYNRLSVSALAVLFLQTFGGGGGANGARYRFEMVVDVALAAFLLNVLFLIKISGCLLGLMIMLAGCAIRGRVVYQVLTLCVALVAFAAITAIEFKMTGLEFFPVIQEYEVAAHARLTYSLYEVARSMVFGPLATSVVLLLLFAVSQRPAEPRLDFRWLGLIIGSYAACQFALNMTNAGASMWLAPAAVASLAGCIGMKPVAWQAGGSERWWQWFAPSRLAEISVREAIPFVIFVLVLIPQVAGSLVGIAVGALVSSGIEEPYVVTAGKGVSFRSFTYPRGGPDVYERSLNDAAIAIASLNLGHEIIATLDHTNPFPVLFLAPPPKGNHVWFYWGFNLPQDAVLEWQDVIGDACVVTIPAQPGSPEVTVRLTEFVRSKLATDFEIVHQDELWSIYRRTRDCSTAPHS